MRGRPRGSPRSVDRGAYRRGIERRKQCSPGCRCRRGKQKATGAGPTSQGPSPSRVVFRPSACTYTSCAGTGISLSSPWEAGPGPHREGRRPSPMMNGAKKSDSLIVPAKPANKAGHPAAELVEGSSGTKGNAKLQSTVRTQSREAVSQAQDRIRGAVTRGQEEKLTALLHHITVDVLRQAFFNLKKRAAPGVDGVTWVDYAADLDRNLTDLHARVHRGAYRALPSRRRYIPKADGKQRPLGIAAIEDKIVQAAVVAILTPVYEAEFLGFSYGFRPGRSQHDALDALAYGIKARKINWILDADISRFFDSLSPDWLVRFVEHRIGDQRIIRLIQKWLQGVCWKRAAGSRQRRAPRRDQGPLLPRWCKTSFRSGGDDPKGLSATPVRRRLLGRAVVAVSAIQDAMAGSRRRRCDGARQIPQPSRSR